MAAILKEPSKFKNTSSSLSPCLAQRPTTFHTAGRRSGCYQEQLKNKYVKLAGDTFGVKSRSAPTLKGFSS